jgi:ABC-type transport system substrate-binding protein
MMRRRMIGVAGVALVAILGAISVAAQPVPQKKILHVAQLTLHPGPLDPAQVNSVFGANILENMLEPMLQYDYLARPLKLVPHTLREMPEILEGGKVYICRLKKGILFSDDPAFNGKPRELTATDYAYSFKRLYDPQYFSSQFFMVDGKIAGANALRDAAQKSGRFDVDAPVSGLKVLDRYTLRIELTEPDLNFLHVLAQQNLAAVAREVVEKYGADISTHPVGTGPFQMVEWRPGNFMRLVRNPNYRNEVFNADPGDDAESKLVAERLAGKRLPIVDEVELRFTTDSQPLWLSFLSGEIDTLDNIPVFFRPGAIPGGVLAPNLVKKGIRLQHYAYPGLWFLAFNMNDPVVGGVTPAHVALRRAIGMSIDAQAAIDIAMYGGGTPANGVVPPGIAGHDASFRTDVYSLDLPRARALLDTYGYIDRDGDGWREDPNGKPLTITLINQAEPRMVPWDELYSRAFASIGVRLVIDRVIAQERYKAMQSGKYQVGLDAWNMDFPDAEDFYIILSGKTVGLTNTAQWVNAEFDALYEKSKRMTDSPERNALYRRMDRIMFAYAPVIVHLFLQRSAVSQPWLNGYVPHTIHVNPWKYLDVDMAMRAAKR